MKMERQAYSNDMEFTASSSTGTSKGSDLHQPIELEPQHYSLDLKHRALSTYAILPPITNVLLRREAQLSPLRGSLPK